MTVGRVATAIVVICGIISIPIMKGLLWWRYLQVLTASPRLLSTTNYCGLSSWTFWKKTNSTGAFVGLISGFVMGFSKLLIEAYVSFSSIESGFIKDLADFNFLYYSGILFLISVIIMIITSIMTGARDIPQTNGLSYDTLSDADKAEIRASWNQLGMSLQRPSF